MIHTGAMPERTKPSPSTALADLLRRRDDALAEAVIEDRLAQLVADVMS